MLSNPILLHKLKVLRGDKHVIIDCRCGHGTTLAYLSTALYCSGVGYEAVRGRATFAKRVVEILSDHVLGVNVKVHHRNFLHTSVAISDATIVLMYDQVFDSGVSHRLVDKIISSCPNIVALVKYLPLPANHAAHFHSMDICHVHVSWSNQHVKLSIYRR